MSIQNIQSSLSPFGNLYLITFRKSYQNFAPLFSKVDNRKFIFFQDFFGKTDFGHLYMSIF